MIHDVSFGIGHDGNVKAVAKHPNEVGMQYIEALAICHVDAERDERIGIQQRPDFLRGHGVFIA